MDRPVQRTHVGTFDGGTGDGRQLAGCKVDVHVGAIKPDADDLFVVVELTASLPMTEQRIRVDLPAYAAERLCEAVDEQLTEE